MTRETRVGSAREAVEHTAQQADEVHILWQDSVVLFEAGLEGGTARGILQDMLEVFASWFDLERATRDLWHSAKTAETADEGLKELDAASHELEVHQAEAQRLNAFLTRPFPPVDPVVLANARRAMSEGHYLTAEEMRAAFAIRTRKEC